MKKTSHRTPPKRRAPARAASREGREEPRILSQDEKRELIVAHAQARGRQPRTFGMGYYIAVAASCLVVVSGWWLTLDANLRFGVQERPDEAIEALKAASKSLQESWEGQGSQARERVEGAIEEYKQTVGTANASSTEMTTQ